MLRAGLRRTLRLTALYIVIASLWIVLTDRGADALTDDPSRLSELQTLKGLLFIVFTALLFFALLRYAGRAQQRLVDQALRHADDLEHHIQDRTAELHRTINRIEAILNSSTDLILLVRTSGTIDQINPTASHVLGYGADALFDQPLSTVIADEATAQLQKTLDTVINTVQPQRIETVVRGHDGDTFVADVVLSPMIDHHSAYERVTGVVCAMRDITQHKRLEAQLRDLLNREMQLGELKTRFISVASHELRTPLTMIQMSVEMLTRYEDATSEQDQRQRLAHIQSSVGRATDLLDDLLTMSRIDAGNLEMQPELLDLEALCADMVTAHKVTVAENHTLAFHCVGDCRQLVMDARLLRHIVGNLLSNAVKYSPSGGTITLAIVREGDQVSLTVRDEGIGIPQQEQAHLFAPFHRASNVGKTPGTGLGLTIVKEAVDLHGGTITFESEEGRGTTFTVTLPANGATQQGGVGL